MCEVALENVSKDSHSAGRSTKIDNAVREDVLHLTELRSATWVALAEMYLGVWATPWMRHDCVRGAFFVGAPF